MDEWEQLRERLASAGVTEIGYLTEDLDRLLWPDRKPLQLYRRPRRRRETE